MNGLLPKFRVLRETNKEKEQTRSVSHYIAVGYRAHDQSDVGHDRKSLVGFQINPDFCWDSFIACTASVESRHGVQPMRMYMPRLLKYRAINQAVLPSYLSTWTSQQNVNEADTAARGKSYTPLSIQTFHNFSCGGPLVFLIFRTIIFTTFRTTVIHRA